MPGTFARSALLVAAISLCLPSLARAQAEDAQQAFKDLVARGFQVVATTAISAEMNKTDDPVMVVTMQRGSAVAVCTFSIPGWENMNEAMQTTKSACDVRFY